ncbi:MAG: TFIIB-type zinc ribbon-containing protein [Paracoccus sp. (in: a-proteobacteria)]|nr:zf-TFIIB domain-containing protein [Henriciella sp.]
MLCPVCKVTLTMADRQGVEIDYCPQCRGVWLDRGELDKIIERSAAEMAPPPPAPDPRRRDDDDDDRGRGGYGGGYGKHGGGHGGHGGGSHGGGYRRKSWLREIFD